MDRGKLEDQLVAIYRDEAGQVASVEPRLPAMQAHLFVGGGGVVAATIYAEEIGCWSSAFRVLFDDSGPCDVDEFGDGLCGHWSFCEGMRKAGHAEIVYMVDDGKAGHGWVK